MSLLTGNQLRAARMLVGVDQQQLADAAEVAVNTIRNMEAYGFEPIKSGAFTVERVQKSLELLGVEFITGKQRGVALLEIWGLSAPSRDGTGQGVAIHRGDEYSFMTSIAHARKMAEDAERRGDSRTANNLRGAADEAERDAKGAPKIEEPMIADRDAEKRRNVKKRK